MLHITPTSHMLLLQNQDIRILIIKPINYDVKNVSIH